MPKLPNEDAFRTQLRETLKADFDVARRLLKLAMGFYDPATVPEGEGITLQVLSVTYGLLTKMCKQYRAITALAELGLGEDGVCNARMMFESMLAMQFILKRRVVLKAGKARLAKVAGKPMSSSFRANLYMAKEAFEFEKAVRCMRDLRQLKRVATKKVMDKIERRLKEFEAYIGSEWTDRLRRGYSGLSVEHLANSLNYQSWYMTLYRTASSGVHGIDGLRHVEVSHLGKDRLNLTVGFQPDEHNIVASLRMGALMLAESLDVMNARMHFGKEEDVKKIISEISALYDEWFRTRRDAE